MPRHQNNPVLAKRLPSLGVGAGMAAQNLQVRIAEDADKNRREAERLQQEQVKNALDKRKADQKDIALALQNMAVQIANEKLLVERAKQHVKQERELNEARQLPAYLLAVNDLNIFDPDFPAELAAINAKYPAAYASATGQMAAGQKMTDAGMDHITKSGTVMRFPDGIQTKYRHAEQVLGFEALRDMAKYDSRNGDFLGIDAFAVKQAVQKKEIEDARTLMQPGETGSLSPSGQLTLHPKIPPVTKPVDTSKEEREKRVRDAANHMFVIKQKLIDLNERARELRDPSYARKFKPEKVAAEMKKIEDEKSQILESISSPTPAAEHTQETQKPAAPPTAPARPTPEAPSAPVPKTAPAAPAKKAPPVEDDVDSFTKDFFKAKKLLSSVTAPHAETTGEVETPEEDQTDISERHVGARESILAHAKMLADPDAHPDAVDASREALNKSLGDAGMPQEEIDSVHETLQAGDVPDIQIHPKEKRLTVDTSPKPVASEDDTSIAT